MRRDNLRGCVKTIELHKIGKAYGRNWALNRVSTRFESGRVVVLLGPNGAGKSTLLSIVATLLRPDRGTIRYDSADQREAVQRRRHEFGYVSHDALLYLDLTGRENLRFYGELYGVEGLEERVGALLQRVELTEAADRVARSYSRGMRQRLSIARALLQQPRVLLLDEPFTGLDRWGESAVQTILGEQRDEGSIVLLSTHRLSFPAGFCDEVRVLKRGRLVLDRSVEPGEQLADVYARTIEDASEDAA